LKQAIRPQTVHKGRISPQAGKTLLRQSRVSQQVMLNFRVADLDAMLQQLRDAGVAVLGEEDEDGVGRFAWVADPEGNRVELWQPASGT